METNPQIDLAYEFVQNTNTNIFLTGKAGTGKTTFLHRVKREINKRMVVVAPTGVAAINAEGQTIHSLFQLSFGPQIPGQSQRGDSQKRFNKRKINLLKSLDLLVIDEISMVRSDVLDAIDGVLRRYKDRSRPFGGVQLLMIGDLNQLAPVVRQHEWDLLRPHYNTEYFFGSKALELTHFICIELKHIYRQSNQEFIGLLNKVRDNHIDDEVLSKLNSRYIPNFEPDEDEGYVTLTSHNKTANEINKEKLTQLKGKSFHFEAEIDGIFPENAFPNELKLEFKVGAQVMFVKNDLSEEKRYYNGKLGVIEEIKGDVVKVRSEEEDELIEVEASDWQNNKYSLDAKTKEVTEELVGTFSQIPLKLAWAITIHKSQGLTFEKVVIDAQDAFAHGQVYVALSRCKTFEGIVLRSEIRNSSVKTDAVIASFTEDAHKNEPGEEELKKAKHAFQQEILISLFEMKNLKYAIQNLTRSVLESERSLQGTIVKDVQLLAEDLSTQFFKVGNTFVPVLGNYFKEESLPEKNQELIDRLKKAGAYFTDKIKNEVLGIVNNLTVLTDNQEIEEKVEIRITEVQKELRKSLAGFKACEEGFKLNKIIRSSADADIDFDKKVKKSVSTNMRVPSNIDNKELYKKLTSWRNSTADYEDVKAYRVLTSRSIIEICNVLPSQGSSLKRIHGIGKAKLDKYGQEILEIVLEYIEEHNLEKDQLEYASSKKEKAKKEPKKPSKDITFELYKEGKTVKEIAKQRGYTEGTITTHLTEFIGSGEIDVFELLDKKTVNKINDYFEESKNPSLKDAVEHFKNKYDYGTTRIVREYWASNN